MNQLEKDKLYFAIIGHTTMAVIVIITTLLWIFWPEHIKTRIILTLCSCSIIAFYNYRLHKNIFAWQEQRRHELALLAKEKEVITAFLRLGLNEMSIENLQKAIAAIALPNFSPKLMKQYGKDIFEQLDRARHTLEQKEQEEKVRDLRIAKKEIEKEIAQLKHVKEQEEIDAEGHRLRMKNELDLAYNNVFLTEDLNEEEMNILKEEGYKQINEYDITSERIVSAMVRPPLNHSATHAFLVWSARVFLEQNLEYVENIKEHLTKDADITFKYADKTYALEIETGNLLRKKKQLLEKVNYLNKKYKRRWMFIVSNKNLVAEYRKHSLATQRKDMAKNLEKLLGTSTQENRVENKKHRRKEH